MRRPFFVIALRLLAENTRLRHRNKRLLSALILANDTAEKANALAAQARRDADLLALMAKDREQALAFLRDAHRIDRGEVA